MHLYPGKTHDIADHDDRRGVDFLAQHVFRELAERADELALSLERAVLDSAGGCVGRHSRLHQRAGDLPQPPQAHVKYQRRAGAGERLPVWVTSRVTAPVSARL